MHARHTVPVRLVTSLHARHTVLLSLVTSCQTNDTLYDIMTQKTPCTAPAWKVTSWHARHAAPLRLVTSWHKRHTTAKWSWSVGWSISWSVCNYFLKGREAYQSTCFYIVCAAKMVREDDFYPTSSSPILQLPGMCVTERERYFVCQWEEDLSGGAGKWQSSMSYCIDCLPFRLLKTWIERSNLC